jgi:membrane protein YdbS with pleckstrin-like domain
VPDPFLFIVAIIAIVCVVLFPVRLWRRRRHRYESDDEAGT